MADLEFLRPINWQYVAIDEAHRLKNSSSKCLEVSPVQQRYSRATWLTVVGIIVGENAEYWSFVVVDGHAVAKQHWRTVDTAQFVEPARKYCERAMFVNVNKSLFVYFVL